MSRTAQLLYNFCLMKARARGQPSEFLLVRAKQHRDSQILSLLDQLHLNHTTIYNFFKEMPVNMQRQDTVGCLSLPPEAK